jgi:hypothetical protein
VVERAAGRRAVEPGGTIAVNFRSPATRVGQSDLDTMFAAMAA